MSNHFFHFKEFTVHQDRCAMKVCTDACLFGAWISSFSDRINSGRFLDIGTGTGLLSLMIAQKNTSIIDAVEIDDMAALQATANFRSSSWNERLKVIRSSIQEYLPSYKYDFIFSNPPFFENDLKSSDIQRNLALHSEALGLEELLHHIKRLLCPEGLSALLLPFHRSEYFESLAKDHGFYIHEKLLVKQTPRHHYFRVMYLFGFFPDPAAVIGEMVIKTDSVHYSNPFSELLKDYYLIQKRSIEHAEERD